MILRTLMTARMTIRTRELPAAEVFESIRTATGLPIVARLGGDTDFRGLDGEHPITLNFVNVPAIEVLETVLEACSDFDRECTWQIRGSMLEVGTKERLASSLAQEVRYYTVGDLLLEVPNYDNAPALDLSTALTQGRGGGGAGGAGGAGGGSGSDGGALFPAPGTDPREGRDEMEQAHLLVELIRETIEPDGWRSNGGSWASIRFYQGALIVRAPDFVHRQIRNDPVLR